MTVQSFVASPSETIAKQRSLISIDLPIVDKLCAAYKRPLPRVLSEKFNITLFFIRNLFIKAKADTCGSLLVNEIKGGF